MGRCLVTKLLRRVVPYWFITHSQSDLDAIATQNGLGLGFSIVFSGTSSAYTEELAGKVITKIKLPVKPLNIKADTTLSIGTIDNATPTSVAWGSDKQEINIGSYAAQQTGGIFAEIPLQSPITISNGKYLQIFCTNSDVICGSERVNSRLSDYVKRYKTPYICGNSFNTYFAGWVTPIGFYGF